MKKTKEKVLQAPTRFIILLTTGLIALVIMIGLSLYFGAETSVTLKVLSMDYFILMKIQKTLMKSLCETYDFLVYLLISW